MFSAVLAASNVKYDIVIPMMDDQPSVHGLLMGLGLLVLHHLSPRPSQPTPRPETLATPLTKLVRKFCIIRWAGGAAGKLTNDLMDE